MDWFIRRYHAAAQVDKGRKRENNEDNLYFNGVFLTEQAREQPAQFATEPNSGAQIYAVCDGMGGEQMGETASLLAAQAIDQYAADIKTAPIKETDGVVLDCIAEANRLICEARQGAGVGRIGTTLALLALKGRRAFVYNVGDSRVYLLRETRLRQLSEDHTAVMQMIKHGVLTPEQAKSHPRRNSLTQYVGIEPEEMVIEPYAATLKTKRGDMFLLCSDGLTDLLDDSELEGILCENSRPDDAVTRLVEMALERGGKDNITVIAVRAQ
jgi:serine/threonine protein phosphatase PrpC